MPGVLAVRARAEKLVSFCFDQWWTIEVSYRGAQHSSHRIAVGWVPVLLKPRAAHAGHIQEDNSGSPICTPTPDSDVCLKRNQFNFLGFMFACWTAQLWMT